MVKHQLFILNRGRERALSLAPAGRIVASLSTLFIRHAPMIRAAVVLKQSILLAFHTTLVKRKYRHLFSPKRRSKRVPNGPLPELVTAIVETKRRQSQLGTVADSHNNFVLRSTLGLIKTS